MIDIQYNSFVIKLKQFDKDQEWLATIRNKGNQTIASNWLPTQSQGEQWAKKLIDGLKPED